MLRLDKQIVALCRCGCGQSVYLVNPSGYVNRFGYCRGHNPRRRRVLPADALVSWRNRHTRSRALVPEHERQTCAWRHIGGCRGPIEVAHVNGDDTDNRRSNLKPLCMSHHRLLDNGRINPADPVMPQFRTDGGNKRRYVH